MNEQKSENEENTVQPAPDAACSGTPDSASDSSSKIFEALAKAAAASAPAGDTPPDDAASSEPAPAAPWDVIPKEGDGGPQENTDHEAVPSVNTGDPASQPGQPLGKDSADPGTMISEVLGKLDGILDQINAAEKAAKEMALSDKDMPSGPADDAAARDN